MHETRKRKFRDLLSTFQEDSSPRNKTRKMKLVDDWKKLTDGKIDSLDTISSKHCHWEEGGSKSGIVGVEVGTVGRKKEVFELKMRDLMTIGGGGGREELKPTEIQPRTRNVRVKKEETGTITNRNPLGSQVYQPENRFQDHPIRALVRHISDQGHHSDQ